MPPNGNRGSDLTSEFTKHDPASSPVLAMASPLVGSVVNTAAPNQTRCRWQFAGPRFHP